MNIRNILMIGGTGFLGSHLARRLGSQGFNLRLATRRREQAKHLLPLPTAEVIEADVTDPAALAHLMAGQDVVINLVGILAGGTGKPYGKGFASAHVELPQKIVAAMQATGVTRLLHVSALKAAADAPSGYLRSKAAGEAVVLGAHGIDATVFRPSVIFGAGDGFLNLFAGLLRIAPFLPLACPAARFQPVWVEDVAACMAISLTRPESLGQTYDLCGPRQYSLRQLVEYVGRVTGRQRPVIGLSDALSYLQAWVMEFVPGVPMSRDSYFSMQTPSLCEATCSLPFAVSPTPLEAVARSYLTDGRPRARNDEFRAKARR